MGIKDDNELGDEAAALALLSPEERAAMGIDDEEENDIVNELAEGAEDDAGDKKPAEVNDDDDNDDDDSDGDDDQDDDTVAVAKPEVTPPAEESAPVEVPALDLAPVEQGYKDKLTALNAEKAAQFKKLMDGEIDAEEYSTFESDYFTKRDALAEERSGNAAWFKEVHDFKAKAMQDGVNYFGETEHNEALDAWVKRLAAKPENGDKDASWFLTEAHRKVMIEFEIAAPAAKTAAKPAGQQKNVSVKKGRAPDLSTIPPTLGGLPAAAEGDAGDGEFSHLDKLSGMDLERALAKMNPEQQERYLRD